MPGPGTGPRPGGRETLLYTTLYIYSQWLTEVWGGGGQTPPESPRF
jgi:hypothetical protein